MKGGVTQFTVEKTSTTKNFPHHDLGRRSRKEGGNELIILLLLPSLVFPPFIRHRVFFTPQWVLKQYFLYPSSLSPLLYLFFCNTTKLSKEINRFFSAFTQTLEANVLEHVCGYFPPMLSFVVLLLLRFALRELKNQYYFPVAADQQPPYYHANSTIFHNSNSQKGTKVGLYRMKEGVEGKGDSNP